jgi:hypothetical protein
MFIRDTEGVYRSQIEAKLGDNPTGRQVLDYIFGERGEYGYPSVNWVIRNYYEEDRTAIHRLNMFWAIPLTLLCAPYQYIVKGRVGWDTKTKFGRFILRVTGHYKEI